MFSVVFEVQPQADRWDTYLGMARMLKPELEQIDGFIDNVRYGSLTREGWLVSLSSWRDEKALVRWRTQVRHHQAQAKGREAILQDYHLRIGQFTGDTQPPDGHVLSEQRLDETQTGDATTITLISASRSPDGIKQTPPDAIAASLGFPPNASGLIGWDVFEAVLTPGDVLLLQSWRDLQAAQTFEQNVELPDGARLRRIRVIRDYGMFDRREAPQYFPDATGHSAIRG